MHSNGYTNGYTYEWGHMSGEQQPTIKDFLLARIAEDEECARAAAESTNDRSHVAPDEPFGATWEALDYGMVRGGGEYNDLWDCEGSETLCTSVEAAAHIARHDPARVLAECAAKRSIIGPPVAEELKAWSHGVGASPDTLRALAAVYSDHPDYRQEWALNGAR